jgi:hypothetical protein
MDKLLLISRHNEKSSSLDLELTFNFLKAFTIGAVFAWRPIQKWSKNYGSKTLARGIQQHKRNSLIMYSTYALFADHFRPSPANLLRSFFMNSFGYSIQKDLKTFLG